jgi:hypothetical protein
MLELLYVSYIFEINLYFLKILLAPSIKVLKNAIRTLPNNEEWNG